MFKPDFQNLFRLNFQTLLRNAVCLSSTNGILTNRHKEFQNTTCGFTGTGVNKDTECVEFIIPTQSEMNANQQLQLKEYLQDQRFDVYQIHSWYNDEKGYSVRVKINPSDRRDMCAHCSISEPNESMLGSLISWINK